MNKIPRYPNILFLKVIQNSILWEKKHWPWKHQSLLVYVCVCVCVCVCADTQSCPTLHIPLDYSPPGSSIHVIFQANILEWVAFSYSRVSPWPRDQNHIFCVSCIGRQILDHCTTWETPKRLNDLGQVNQAPSFLLCESSHGAGVRGKREFFLIFSEYRGFPGSSDGKKSACYAGDPGSTSGSGRCPGEGNGNPLQYSCLENFMDGGAWRATVQSTWLHKSRTQLSN